MAANDLPCCQTMFWVYLVISMVLVAFAGLMSGLTLGLMSLSLVDLEVISKAGAPQDRKNAAKILPIVKNQHLLLCTLLICNAMAMEALPVFLDSILSEWTAILISVTLILAFGEIIPQAVCTRYGLSVGARLSFIVRILLIIFFPLAYPISKLLDYLLGKERSALLRRAELRTLVDMLGNEAGKGGELTRDETTIISGALDLTSKTVKDAMTPMSDVFALNLNSKLDDETMSLVTKKGHSRVPVYSGRPSNIIGLILVKHLIKCRPEEETPIRSLAIRRIPRVNDNLPLYDLLNQFRKGHSHMAVVVKSDDKETVEEATVKIDLYNGDSISLNSSMKKSENELHTQLKKGLIGDTFITSEVLETLPDSNDDEVVGIITMEDVLEELLQGEILDETDECVDVHNNIKINMHPANGAAATTSHVNWRSPTGSPSPFSSSHPTPVSSYHHTILHSPISPYRQSPFPGKSTPNSPSGFSGLVHGSPASPRVSRKSYEKLRKPGDQRVNSLQMMVPQLD